MADRSYKILYVEDEPSLAKIVHDTLASNGYEVAHVEHGSQAISRFHQFAPDLCILDVMLPGKDGFEIGKEIRQFNQKIPILFLTAKSQLKDTLEGFQSGGNDYIRKPFSLEELLIRIKNLIHLTQSAAEDASDTKVAIGSLTLDIRRQLLISDTIHTKLSYRETKLLGLLARRQNAVIERKQILQELWGDDSFFNSRNLDVYITKLRKYLKADPDVELITLKGVGYRLVV